jgi:hypothetical protein
MTSSRSWLGRLDPASVGATSPRSCSLNGRVFQHAENTSGEVTQKPTLCGTKSGLGKCLLRDVDDGTVTALEVGVAFFGVADADEVLSRSKPAGEQERDQVAVR